MNDTTGDAAAQANAQASLLAEEDQARADLYALFARLFHSGPDAGLLAAIAANGGAGGGDAPFEQAWDALCAASATADAAAVAVEYDTVFIGTGKAEVTPYASHYLVESGRERVLVSLRDELAAMGLARHAAVHEPEDHFAALFDVMRHLISLPDSGDAALQKQAAFFRRYLASGFAAFFGRIDASPNAVYYKHVSRCAMTFMEIESEALNMSNG